MCTVLPARDMVRDKSDVSHIVVSCYNIVDEIAFSGRNQLSVSVNSPTKTLLCRPEEDQDIQRKAC